MATRVFHRFERAGQPVPGESRLRAAVGLAAAVAGIALLVTGGLYKPSASGGVPLTALGLFLGGLGALGVIRSQPSRAAPIPDRPSPE